MLKPLTIFHIPYEKSHIFSLSCHWGKHDTPMVSQLSNMAIRSVSRFPTEVHLISWHLNAISSSWVGLYLLPGHHSRGGWEKNRGLEIEREQPAYLLQSVAILPFHHTLWEPLLTGFCVWPLPWISL